MRQSKSLAIMKIHLFLSDLALNYYLCIYFLPRLANLLLLGWFQTIMVALQEMLARRVWHAFYQWIFMRTMYIWVLSGLSMNFQENHLSLGFEWPFNTNHNFFTNSLTSISLELYLVSTNSIRYEDWSKIEKKTYIQSWCRKLEATQLCSLQYKHLLDFRLCLFFIVRLKAFFH